jgi:hypothetical protein
MLKSILIVILLVLFGKLADAQSTQPIAPIKSTEVTAPQQPAPTLNLGDLNKVVGPAPAPANGVLFYFDYTQFLQWLIPKKHPKVPPECDPKFFLNDSIPSSAPIYKDTVRVIKPPV